MYSPLDNHQIIDLNLDYFRKFLKNTNYDISKIHGSWSNWGFLCIKLEVILIQILLLMLMTFTEMTEMWLKYFQYPDSSQLSSHRPTYLAICLHVNYLAVCLHFIYLVIWLFPRFVFLTLLFGKVYLTKNLFFLNSIYTKLYLINSKSYLNIFLFIYTLNK